jgi:hypothetical protein
MEWFKTIVGSMSPETVFFIVLIFVFFIFLNLSFNRRAVTQGPTILTTFGIFGTFVGIAIGLSEFDTTNVRDGVPALLSGLKTAFWASVFGVGGALMLKLRMFLMGSGEDDDLNRADEATVADVVKAIHGLHHSIAGLNNESLSIQLKRLQKTSDQTLAALKQALGDEDTNTPDSVQQPNDDNAFNEPIGAFGKRTTSLTTAKSDTALTPSLTTQ